MAYNLLKRGWHWLAQMKVAAILITVTLLLVGLGSCFPQAPASVTADAQQLARWETEVRTRYGLLTDLLRAGGVFRWFHSPVLLVPTVLLTLATFVCTLDRWRGVWQRVFHRPARPPRTIFEVAPYTANLTAPPLHLVRQHLEEQGFWVQSETAQGVVYLRGDRYRWAPLATFVTHLAVLLLLLGAILSSSYGWREELTVEPGQTVEVGHENRLRLRNEGFTISRYPDGNVAAYTAQLTLVEGNGRVVRRRVGVNRPLSYEGIGFYLQSYEASEDGYRVTLLAVYDPGYGLVIAAGFLLLLGLTVSFNFPHCWLYARIDPEGTMRLAGRAERWACDFGREFIGLVEKLQRLTEASEGRAS